MAEAWRDIAGYEGMYQVSDHGRVRSLDRIVADGKGGQRRHPGKMLKASPNKSLGYPMVSLHRNGVREQEALVHRLVAAAFLPADSDRLHVNHIDGTKTNNHVSNLEWCTHAENIQHAGRTGLMQRGMDRHNAKLSDFKVRLIRVGRKHGLRVCDLAQIFGVHPSHISKIAAGKKRAPKFGGV